MNGYTEFVLINESIRSEYSDYILFLLKNKIILMIQPFWMTSGIVSFGIVTAMIVSPGIVLPRSFLPGPYRSGLTGQVRAIRDR